MGRRRFNLARQLYTEFEGFIIGNPKVIYRNQGYDVRYNDF